MEPIALKIEYCPLPDGSPTGLEPDGIDEFRSELQTHYVSLVRGQSGECGGGLYDMVVHVTSSITLRDVVSAILGGIAYDLVKTGTQSFILRPLISTIEKLKERNKKNHQKIDIDEFRFSFQDADIVVKNISVESFFEELEKVFKQLSNCLDTLRGNTQEMPYIIHIPVFEDPDQKICRFRSLLDVDETIEEITSDSYLQYWGVRYNLEGKIRVFDVKKKLLIDSRYMTQDEYWKAAEKEWEKERAD